MPKVLFGEIRVRKTRPNYRHPSYSAKLKVEKVRLGQMIWPEDRAEMQRKARKKRRGGARRCTVRGCDHPTAAHEPNGPQECTMPGCPCRGMRKT